MNDTHFMQLMSAPRPQHLLLLKRQLSSRTRFYISKFLKSGNSDLEHLFSKFLSKVLGEEYAFIQNYLGNVEHSSSHVYDSDHESISTAVSSRRVRKVSEYVLFCRYMKMHHPEQQKLQEVWKKINRHDWRKQFGMQMTDSIISHTQSEPITTIEVNQVPQHIRSKYDTVMQELELISDEDGDYQRTLMNIQLQKKCDDESSCEESSDSMDTD